MEIKAQLMTPQDAFKKLCPYNARHPSHPGRCAADECMAWNDLGQGKGYCIIVEKDMSK